MWLTNPKAVLAVLLALLSAGCAARGLDVGLTAEELVVVRDPISKQ